MASLCAAQAQIRYSATGTGAGLVGDSTDNWTNWYTNGARSNASTSASTTGANANQVSPDSIKEDQDPPFAGNTYYNSPAGMISKYTSTTRKLPYINLWKNAETESNQSNSASATNSATIPMVSPFHDSSTPGPPRYDDHRMSPLHFA